MTDLESIDASEAEYHAHVLAATRSAQAAWESWATHLAAKYRLGPQDTILESGEIVRHAVPGPETPPA